MTGKRLRKRKSRQLPSLRRTTAKAAILATLAPGAYTAILSGKDDATGVALVEAYALD